MHLCQVKFFKSYSCLPGQMEDMFQYKVLNASHFSFFGIYDGHAGCRAAQVILQSFREIFPRALYIAAPHHRPNPESGTVINLISAVASSRGEEKHATFPRPPLHPPTPFFRHADGSTPG